MKPAVLDRSAFPQAMAVCCLVTLLPSLACRDDLPAPDTTAFTHRFVDPTPVSTPRPPRAAYVPTSESEADLILETELLIVGLDDTLRSTTPVQRRTVYPDDPLSSGVYGRVHGWHTSDLRGAIWDAQLVVEPAPLENASSSLQVRVSVNLTDESGGRSILATTIVVPTGSPSRVALHPRVSLKTTPRPAPRAA